MQNTIKLRSLTEADHPALVKLANNRKIWKNLRDMFPHPYTDDNGHAFIKIVAQDKKNLRSAIEVDGKFVGMIGVFPQDDVNKYTAEMGYWLGEPYWGKGIMSEAIRLKCKQVFESTEMNRIFAAVFSYNVASAKVLEKNGFEFEGIAKEAVFKDGAFCDEHRYALLKRDFSSNNF